MHSELLARLEAADGPSDELDALIWWHCIGKRDGWEYDGQVREPYSASIDAALTLVPDGWRMAALCQRDPWFCRLETDDFESVTWGKGGDWITEVTSGNEATANAPTPALAIVIAALRAIEACAKGVINE